MPRILIACDKFKGSASAAAVARALERGIREAAPGADVRSLPIADGGDGTIDAALAAGFEQRSCTVLDAYGAPRAARYAYAPDRRAAVVEVAEACGIAGVDPHLLRSGALDAAEASSSGVGQLLLAALDAGAEKVTLGLGGSATTDGGLGMMRALGVDVLDDAGRSVGAGAAGAARAARVDASRLDPRIASTAVLVACDVTNPLCGPEGAAAVFGPQKGVPAARIAEADDALHRFACLVERAFGGAPGEWATAAGAGAAGGLGFASLAVLGGEMRRGIDLVLDLVGFDAALDGVDLIVTGEGRLDAQTLSGKAPSGVVARSNGVPVVMVCGSSALPRRRALEAGFREVFPLVEIEPDVSRCMGDPGPVLEQAGRRIGAGLRQWIE